MNEIYRAEVEKSLEDILSDSKFMAAPQMTAFLRYVVSETLNGSGNRIKAYTVAVEALGKPGTFDPQNDPSVRVLAKRLRDTLSHYYERTRGHAIFIRLERGSYVPKFVRNTAMASKPFSMHLVKTDDEETTDVSYELEGSYNSNEMKYTITGV